MNAIRLSMVCLILSACVTAVDESTVTSAAASVGAAVGSGTSSGAVASSGGSSGAATTSGASGAVTSSSSGSACQLAGIVTTVAGRPNDAGLVDGYGSSAQFDQPYGIALQGGMLYVADAYSRAIRQIDPTTGHVTTVAGGDSKCSDVNGYGTAGTFCDVNGVLAYGSGLLVTDDSALRYLVPPSTSESEWDVTTWSGQLAMDGVPPTGVDAGPFSSALYGVPQGIAAIGQTVYSASKLDGFVLMTDPVTQEVSLLSVIGGGASGNTTIQLAGLTAVNGLLYASIEISAGSVIVIDPAAPSAPNYQKLIADTLDNPDGLCSDGTNLYIMEAGKNRVLAFNLATQALSVVAGDVANTTEQDGVGTAAGFDNPRGCVFDNSSCTLYVTDRFGYTVRRIQ